jgi:hypothetical protein
MYIPEYRKIIPFILYTLGGAVVHSYGRLILHERVITDGHQLQPPNDDNGDGRIECTVSSGGATFGYNRYNAPNGNSGKTIAVIPAGDFSNFVNLEGGCGGIYHYLFLSDGECTLCIFGPKTDVMCKREGSV